MNLFNTAKINCHKKSAKLGTFSLSIWESESAGREKREGQGGNGNERMGRYGEWSGREGSGVEWER
jgi:hypothetical protein